jgi:PAS domain S-box-containing protein
MERGPEIGGVQNDLRRVVDALPGLIWTAQPDGQIDFVNQRWCEYTGLSANEAHGRGWQTAIHPEDLPLLLERWRAILTSGETREMEARLRRFDGEYRKFVLRACPLMEESGRIIRWCGINTDVEDRRRLDAELKLTEARKTAILDSALDCIVTIDHEGCITEFNPAAERTFGYRRDQAMGKQLADLIIPPSLRNQHRQGFARYLATGGARVLVGV